MFTQLNIHAVPGPDNNWLPSEITVYRAAGSDGFVPPPQGVTLADFDPSLLTAVQTGVGYLVTDAASNGYVVEALIITPLADFVDGTWDRTNPEHPVFTETVRRKQYSVGLTRSKDGASGSLSLSTEALPDAVRDAWLLVLANF